MTSDMKIKSIAPWFGGKRTLAPEIVAELGPHTQYFEPFCGSMAVLLAKPPCSQETVNDLHGDATNLAWVLQDGSLAEELYDRATRTLFAEAMIRQFWRDLQSPPPEHMDAERAYKFFVFSWAMRNGVAGTSRMRGNGFQIALRFTAGGGSPTVRFRSAVESIPAWHDRLRNAAILRRDAFELIEKFDDAQGLRIYADPPYMSESRSGFAAAGATSRYEHEFEHRIERRGLFDDDSMPAGQAKEPPTHERLAKLLRKFERARIVVSYYDCPRVRRLYEGWTFVEKPQAKTIQVQNGRGTSRAEIGREVLIINGPSLATDH